MTTENMHNLAPDHLRSIVNQLTTISLNTFLGKLLNASFFLASVIAINGCNSSKQRVKLGYQSFEKQHVIVTKENYNLITGKSRTDSIYLYFEDGRFSRYSGMRGSLRFFNVDGQVEILDFPGRTTWTGPEAQFIWHNVYVSEIGKLSHVNSVMLKYYQKNRMQKVMVWSRVDKANNEISFDSSERIEKMTLRSVLNKFDLNDSTIFSFRYIDSAVPKTYFKEIITIVDSAQLIQMAAELSLPFKTTASLDSIRFVTGPKYESGKRVILYSYVGCAPCAVLKREVNALVEKGEIDAASIAVVNTLNTDEEMLKYNSIKDYKFAFYGTNQAYTQGSFPKVGAYDEFGNLQWKFTGYSPKVIKEIKLFLRVE